MSVTRAFVRANKIIIQCTLEKVDDADNIEATLNLLLSSEKVKLSKIAAAKSTTAQFEIPFPYSMQLGDRESQAKGFLQQMSQGQSLYQVFESFFTGSGSLDVLQNWVNPKRTLPPATEIKRETFNLKETPRRSQLDPSAEHRNKIHTLSSTPQLPTVNQDDLNKQWEDVFEEIFDQIRQDQSNVGRLCKDTLEDVIRSFVNKGIAPFQAKNNKENKQLKETALYAFVKFNDLFRQSEHLPGDEWRYLESLVTDIVLILDDYVPNPSLEAMRDAGWEWPAKSKLVMVDGTSFIRNSPEHLLAERTRRMGIASGKASESARKSSAQATGPKDVGSKTDFLARQRKHYQNTYVGAESDRKDDNLPVKKTNPSIAWTVGELITDRTISSESSSSFSITYKLIRGDDLPTRSAVEAFHNKKQDLDFPHIESILEEKIRSEEKPGVVTAKIGYEADNRFSVTVTYKANSALRGDELAKMQAAAQAVMKELKVQKTKITSVSSITIKSPLDILSFAVSSSQVSQLYDPYDPEEKVNHTPPHSEQVAKGAIKIGSQSKPEIEVLQDQDTGEVYITIPLTIEKPERSSLQADFRFNRLEALILEGTELQSEIRCMALKEHIPLLGVVLPRGVTQNFETVCNAIVDIIVAQTKQDPTLLDIPLVNMSKPSNRAAIATQAQPDFSNSRNRQVSITERQKLQDERNKKFERALREEDRKNRYKPTKSRNQALEDVRQRQRAAAQLDGIDDTHLLSSSLPKAFRSTSKPPQSSSASEPPAPPSPKNNAS